MPTVIAPMCIGPVQILNGAHQTNYQNRSDRRGKDQSSVHRALLLREQAHTQGMAKVSDGADAETARAVVAS